MRRLLSWSAALALAACAGAPPAPGDIRSVPENFPARSVPGMSIRVYNTAEIKAPGRMVSKRKGWFSRVKMDFPAFLIAHPKEGYVLFDTGFDPRMETEPAKVIGRLNHFFAPFKIARGQSIAAQLARDGVSPAQVKYVVISHLHLDHVGSVESFPAATVLVDRREWEAQKAKQSRKFNPHEIDPAAVEGRIHLRLVDASSAPPYGAFDHAEDLFGDGSIYLVDLAGHTAGNMGAWINMDRGPVLLAGDASWVMDNHRDLSLPVEAHIWNVAEYRRRLYMMRAMQKAVPSLVIFPGHDLSPLTLQPRSDVSLVPFPR